MNLRPRLGIMEEGLLLHRQGHAKSTPLFFINVNGYPCLYASMLLGQQYHLFIFLEANILERIILKDVSYSQL